MTLKKSLLTACCLVFFVNAAPQVRADQDNGLLDLNAILVDGELYIWNRLSDILDILRGGIAGGPGLGAEVAITNYLQLGAYSCNEKGTTFPHFFIPFWLVDYYESNEPIFIPHDGQYATVAFGPWRAETKTPANQETSIHFPRDRWDIRAQLDFVFLHAYLSIRPTEIWDLLTGFVGWDPSGDDMKLDKHIIREPSDQFGRGICNILFGVMEIPQNMIRVNEEEGDLAGISKGLGLGVWRFLCREVVGVVELVTFPFGWKPIIEPEYVIFQKARNSVWVVNKPSFKKDFR